MKYQASLYSRLIFSHLLVSLVSVTLIAAFAGNSIFRAAKEDIRHSLEDMAYATSDALMEPLPELSTGQLDSPLMKQTLERLLAIHPELVYTLYRIDGTPVLDNDEQLPPKADPIGAPEVWAALQSDAGKGEHTRANSLGEQMLYVAVRIHREGNVLAILRLGTAIEPSLNAARQTLALLLIMSLLVAMGMSLFGWRIAYNLALPIQRLTRTSERLANGDLSARVKPIGTHEMQRMSLVFNIMASRLQDHVDELRAFVANASHELRTPLTVVKLRAEALQAGALNDPAVSKQFLSEIESEVDRLSKMVNDLLDLSRMEAGLASSQRTLLNLDVIASEVCETFKIRAVKAGITLEKHAQADLPPVMGNEEQLRRVLYNFIDNAIKYTAAGGRVDLQLESDAKRKTIRLMVVDSGPGIPSSHLAHIFERFYRVDATRPRYETTRGSGLGLAIAKSIIEKHGGKIGVRSQLGKGSTFWAELPARA